jgi:hypothetical protein
VEGTVVVNGVGSVHKNLFSSWSVGYSFNTENFVINYNAADNTTASLARVESGAIDYLITDGRIEPANLPADALQVPVTGSALVMAINLDGVNVSSLVLPSPSPSFFLGFEEPECLTPQTKTTTLRNYGVTPLSYASSPLSVSPGTGT